MVLCGPIQFFGIISKSMEIKTKTKKHKSEHKKKKKQYTVNKKLTKNPKNNSIKKHLKNKSR